MTLSDIPSRAEFIRDQLAKHLRALGFEAVAEKDETDELPTLVYWRPGAGQARGVSVDTDGTLWAETLGFSDYAADFDWRAVPTDTGVMHGPWSLREAVAAADGAATRWALRWGLDVRGMRVLGARR